MSPSGTVLFQAKADTVGGVEWADGGSAAEAALPAVKPPLGGSHRSAGATAGDSHVIQSKVQKRKQQSALTRLTHTTESTSLEGSSEQTQHLAWRTHTPVITERVTSASI